MGRSWSGVPYTHAVCPAPWACSVARAPQNTNMAASLDDLRIDRAPERRRSFAWVAWLVVFLVLAGGGAAGWVWWQDAQAPVVTTGVVYETTPGDSRPTVLNASGLRDGAAAGHRLGQGDREDRRGARRGGHGGGRGGRCWPGSTTRRSGPTWRWRRRNCRRRAAPSTRWRCGWRRRGCTRGA